MNALFDSARRAIGGTNKGKGAVADATHADAELRRPLLRVELSSRQSFGAPPPIQRSAYGTATGQGPPSATSSTRSDSYLQRVPEDPEPADADGDDGWEAELEQQGYYIGEHFPWYSYSSLC